MKEDPLREVNLVEASRPVTGRHTQTRIVPSANKCLGLVRTMDFLSREPLPN